MVSWGNRTQWASTLLMPDAASGDCVLVIGGTIIERVDPSEAAARREVFDAMLAMLDEPVDEKDVKDVGRT